MREFMLQRDRPFWPTVIRDLPLLYMALWNVNIFAREIPKFLLALVIREFRTFWSLTREFTKKWSVKSDQDPQFATMFSESPLPITLPTTSDATYSPRRK